MSKLIGSYFHFFKTLFMAFLLALVAIAPVFSQDEDSVESKDFGLRTALEQQLKMLDGPFSRPQVKSKLRKAGGVAGRSIHTIVLLSLLGASEAFAKHIKEYCETGDEDAYFKAWDEAWTILAETGLAASLQFQVGGAFVMGLGTKLATYSSVGLATLEATNFYVHHAIHFIGFFGWEFGAELYSHAFDDFTKRILEDDNSYNDIDTTRAANIFKLLWYSELRNEFFVSIIHVLFKSKNLKAMFRSALNRWASFDLLSVYAALRAGSAVGAAAGRVVGQAAGTGVGRLVGGRVGGALGGMIAGPLGAIIGSFVGVIGFVLVKDIKPIKNAVVALDENLIRRSTKERSEKASLRALNVFSVMGHPGFLSGVGGWGKKTANYVLAQKQLSIVRKSRDAAIWDHLILLARPVQDLTPIIERYIHLSLAEKMRVAALLGKIPGDGQQKHAARMSQETTLTLLANGIDMQKKRLKLVEDCSSEDWPSTREAITETTEEEDPYLKTLSQDRAESTYEEQIRYEFKNNPLLTTNVNYKYSKEKWEYSFWRRDKHRVTVVVEKNQKLYEWLLSDLSTEMKSEIIQIAAKNMKKKIQLSEEKYEKVREMLWETKMLNSSHQSVRNKKSETNRLLDGPGWRRNGGATRANAVRSFNLRRSELSSYLGGQLFDIFIDIAKENGKVGMEWFNNYAGGVRKIFDREKEVTKDVYYALNNLLYWPEDNYAHMQEKMGLLTMWASSPFNSILFLEYYREFEETKKARRKAARTKEFTVVLEVLQTEYLMIHSEENEIDMEALKAYVMTNLHPRMKLLKDRVKSW